MIVIGGVEIPDPMVQHFERSDSGRFLIRVSGNPNHAVFGKCVLALGKGKVDVAFGDVVYSGCEVGEYDDYKFGSERNLSMIFRR